MGGLTVLLSAPLSASPSGYLFFVSLALFVSGKAVVLGAQSRLGLLHANLPRRPT